MDGEDDLLEGAEDNEGLGGMDADSQSDKDGRSDAEQLLDALQKIGEAVNMTAEMVDDKVVVDLNAEDASPQEMI